RRDLSLQEPYRTNDQDGDQAEHHGLRGLWRVGIVEEPVDINREDVDPCSRTEQCRYRVERNAGDDAEQSRRAYCIADGRHRDFEKAFEAVATAHPRGFLERGIKAA